VLVAGGAPVKKGDPLLKLRSEELDERRTTIVAEQRELEKTVGLLALRIAATVDDDPAAATRLEAEREDAKVRLGSLAEKLAKLDQRIASLVVISPIDGIVTTFQLEQRLANRPVRFGEMLVEVMQPDGEWRLELEVDERRLGHLSRAREASEEPLDVEFALATLPEKSFHGDLESLATRVRPNQEGGSVLEVFVELDEAGLPARRIGSEVRARVDCGQRTLGFVLFGDVVEFIRRRWWW
jgi:multidrug efflux pump subunit AcrA (membrane-fusion protein)